MRCNLRLGHIISNFNYIITNNHFGIQGRIAIVKSILIYLIFIIYIILNQELYNIFENNIFFNNTENQFYFIIIKLLYYIYVIMYK